MNKNNSGRRKFIQSSVLGLGSISVTPLLAAQDVTAKSSAGKQNQNKLNIVCVGAHPGDPEFGCGGTMAKYSQAGNNVTFLYLTRGEA
jgi:N-acetylglucosamine malate deacetylase 1